MRRPDIGKLVLDRILPIKRAADPQTWDAFVTLHLVKEIRQERLRFYGPPPNPRIEGLGYPIDAVYPGLDYNKPWHRLRLSSYPWHKKLFMALDALELTPGEIDSIMTFEGTKHARQQYEKEHGVVIKDTTGDDILPYVEPFLVLRKSSVLVSEKVLGHHRDPESATTRSASAAEPEPETEPPDESMRREAWRWRPDALLSLDSDSEDDDDSVGTGSDGLTDPGNPVGSFTGLPLVESPENYSHEADLIHEHRAQLDAQMPNGITLNLGSPHPNGGPSTVALEAWRRHAEEHGFPRIEDGEGATVWGVPDRVAEVFLETAYLPRIIIRLNSPGFYDDVSPLDRRSIIRILVLRQRYHYDAFRYEVWSDIDDAEDVSPNTAIAETDTIRIGGVGVLESTADTFMTDGIDTGAALNHGLRLREMLRTPFGEEDDAQNRGEQESPPTDSDSEDEDSERPLVLQLSSTGASFDIGGHRHRLPTVREEVPEIAIEPERMESIDSSPISTSTQNGTQNTAVIVENGSSDDMSQENKEASDILMTESIETGERLIEPSHPASYRLRNPIRRSNSDTAYVVRGRANRIFEPDRSARYSPFRRQTNFPASQ